MNYHDKNPKNHDDVLNGLAEAVDISPGKYKEAVERYQALGRHLDREGSTIKHMDPMISPQGSFLLGTVNRPWDDREVYDLDLVCRLLARRSDLSQAELKKLVGAEIALYAKEHGMEKPEDHRRCWRLNYAETAMFHMDILPSIPDAEGYRRRLNEWGYRDLAASEDLTGHAIAITDKLHPSYNKIDHDWYQSNPTGYAAWFRQRMKVQLELREKLFERQLVTASVNQVPDPNLKTPLQKVIQLLKRHRDFMFRDDPEHKPISIIISTLAAKSYNNEGSISDALQAILLGMDSHIQHRFGVDWVTNPVNPAENFADKWDETPVKRDNFYKWLTAARRDFALYLKGSPYFRLPKQLEESFGSRAVAAALGPNLMPAPAVHRQAERVAAAAESARESRQPSAPWQTK
jgi:hypothetical protein